MPEYRTTTRLYHTADRSRVVEEGDEAAAFLVAGQGEVLTAEAVERLGLTDYFATKAKPKAEAAPEPTEGAENESDPDGGDAETKITASRGAASKPAAKKG